MTPTTTLGQRIFMAHMALAQRLGRRVPQEEFGEIVAKQLRRDEAFRGSSVSEWERDAKTPPIEVVGAIARTVGWDPGWLAYGEESQAPAPPNPVVAATQPAPKKNASRRARGG